MAEPAMTKEELTEYLKETQNFTDAEASEYINEVGLENAIVALDQEASGGDEQQSGVLDTIAQVANTTGSPVRKALIQAIDKLSGSELDKGMPGYEDVGKYPSFADFLGQNEALNQRPSTNKQYGINTLGFPTKFYSAAEGDLLDIINPLKTQIGGPLDVSGAEALGMGLDVATDPATYAGGPVLKGLAKANKFAGEPIEKLGKMLYKMPFKKLDTALLETGASKIPVSDLLYDFNLSGNMQQLRDGLKKSLSEDTWPKIEKILTKIDDSGQKFDFKKLEKELVDELSTETVGSKVGMKQRPLIAPEINKAISDVKSGIGAFKPARYEEYVKQLEDYMNKKKGYFYDLYPSMPQRPKRPDMRANVWETLEAKKDLDDSITRSFYNPNSQKMSKFGEEFDFMTRTKLKNAIEDAAGVVGEKENLQKLNEVYGAAAGAFPDLSKEVIKEAGTPILRPIDYGFAANPYTANMLAAKEAAEAVTSPYFATRAGMGMKNLNKGVNKYEDLSWLLNSPAKTAPFVLSKEYLRTLGGE